MRKLLIAAVVASVALFALAGCGKTASSAAEPKDYTQIIHDARTDEENESMLILSPTARAASPPPTATAPR